MNDRLVHVGALIDEALRQAQFCPDCGQPHPVPASVEHRCMRCQRAETRRRHERITAEVRAAVGRPNRGVA